MMFSIFNKSVSPDRAKIEAFSSWFSSINDDLIASYLAGDRMKYLDEVESHLAIVYRDGYKGEIEFQYGYDPNADLFELFLFHKNKEFLVEAAGAIRSALLPLLGERWVIYCEK